MSKSLEALKRLRQETAPATYMADFDKNKCCDVIEKELEMFELFKKHINSYTWEEDEDFGSGIELQMYFEDKDTEAFYKIRDYIKEWLENE